MINIPGGINNDLCDDGGIKLTRRDLLKVGGSGMLGLSLGSMLQMQAKAKESDHGGGPGWGRAKSVILVYLQGGPSHIDLWDPKPDGPDNVRRFSRAFRLASRDAFHGTPAQAGQGQRQDDHDPLHELHAQWTVQSYGRDLPDDDGYTTDKVSPSDSSSRPAPRISRTLVPTSSVSSHPPSPCCHLSCFRVLCRKAT